MALTTTASALEDIKVNGQAKMWYETWDKPNASGNDSLGDKENSQGEFVFKIGVTGKQGNVGFGTTIYQTSSMGLNDQLISANRTNTTDGDMFVGEAYVTAPMGSGTTLKLGKQELNTPYLFTEKWNTVPNTFNGAVVTNKSIDNLTLVGMYVGQDNATNFKVNGDVADSVHGGALILGALYKNDMFDVNLWGSSIGNVGTTTTQTVSTYWADAGVKVADVKLRAYATMVDGNANNAEETTAYALSAATKIGGVTLFAAASMVDDKGDFSISNFSTDGKKTKLPTAGVYTDGKYVGQVDSVAYKLKAVTKIGSTKLILQGVNNTNDTTASKETTEIDLIAIHKFGDFNVKGILMNRDFDDSATDTTSGAVHARLIVSLNF